LIECGIVGPIGTDVGSLEQLLVLHLLLSSRSVGGPFASSTHRTVTGRADIHIQFMGLHYSQQNDVSYRVGIGHTLLFADGASTNHKEIVPF